MIGPQTILQMETVLAERAREVRLAEGLARLYWDAPRESGHRPRMWSRLRDFALRLAPPPTQPLCCPQIA